MRRRVVPWGLLLAVVPPPLACEPLPPTQPTSAELCANVSENERIRPSFLRAGDLEVRPLKGERRLIKSTVEELRGAELVVRAELGYSKPWIARLTRCHVAWEALARDDLDDPFVTNNPTLSFEEEETGFVIRIQGRNAREGADILARTQRFAAAARPPPAPNPTASVP